MIEAKYVGPHKVPKIGKKFAEDMWQRFLEGGSTHSGQATTLSYFINRCEAEKVPYLLKALPGIGYYIEPLKVCKMCGKVLNDPTDPLSKTCGGDCVSCMAKAGDPDCIKLVEEEVRRGQPDPADPDT